MRVDVRSKDHDGDLVIATALALWSAVGNVAKARGMSSIAERAGFGRESPYKALAPGANPAL